MTFEFVYSLENQIPLLYEQFGISVNIILTEIDNEISKMNLKTMI